MPMLKFRCATCGELFEELVSVSRIASVTCASCGGASVERAYEGKCLFGMAGSSAGRGGSCSGNCESCSGCGGHGSHEHSCSGGCGCCAQ